MGTLGQCISMLSPQDTAKTISLLEEALAAVYCAHGTLMGSQEGYVRSSAYGLNQASIKRLEEHIQLLKYPPWATNQAAQGGGA